MNEIPCKNCITYPICFAQTRNVIGLISFLCNKCSICGRVVTIEEGKGSINCCDDSSYYKIFGVWDNSIGKRIFLNEKVSM